MDSKNPKYRSFKTGSSDSNEKQQDELEFEPNLADSYNIQIEEIPLNKCYMVLL